MENIERLHQNEIILPLIVLLDPSVEETEHNRVLDELQKTVTMIYSNDRTLVDLMIVDKIPAFFDAVFEENIVPRYSTVTNEIAEYVLWKVAKRKQEYRVNSVTYLVPIVLLICDSLNPDVLTLLKNPEWARNIKNRVFYFTLCSTHEKNILKLIILNMKLKFLVLKEYLKSSVARFEIMPLLNAAKACRQSVLEL